MRDLNAKSLWYLFCSCMHAHTHTQRRAHSYVSVQAFCLHAACMHAHGHVSRRYVGGQAGHRWWINTSGLSASECIYIHACQQTRILRANHGTEVGSSWFMQPSMLTPSVSKSSNPQFEQFEQQNDCIAIRPAVNRDYAQDLVLLGCGITFRKPWSRSHGLSKLQITQK